MAVSCRKVASEAEHAFFRDTLCTLQGRSVNELLVVHSLSSRPVVSWKHGHSHGSYRDTDELYEASKSVRTLSVGLSFGLS